MPIAASRAWTPDDPAPRPLWAAIGRPPRGTVTLVGAGGKTTLAHALTAEAAASGARALLVTTTRMTIEPELVDEPAAALRALARPGRVVLAGARVSESKFGPFADAELDRLHAAADVVVVEGDGSRRLPFKVPADYEPVVPAWTDLLLVVAGLSAVGRPLGEVCCRPETAAALLGDRDAAARPLDPATAAVLLRAGYLDNPRLAAWAGRRVVVLNQADDAGRVALGRAVAALLPGERVLLASNHPTTFTGGTP
nr:putative selenium-dependent hydroxylase accessory protein YqeC [Propionibacterium sp.]